MPLRSQFESEQEWLEHLRLYFAAKAMQTLLGFTLQDYSPKSIQEAARDSLDGNGMTARSAYRVADAMLRERSK